MSNVKIEIQYFNKADRELGGRGNVDNVNPFTFSFDILEDKLSVVFDGYAPVTCNKDAVRKAVKKKIKSKYQA